MTTSRGEVIRPLGAAERTIDFAMRKNPLQFSLVAEIDRPVPEAELAGALAELCLRHPLLAATTTPHPGPSTGRPMARSR
ncbi:hypothetical protein [Streptomyces sp. NPDC127033]|uniref:hypothetical protein n=1 Tax=Streptomyces sp. NPDC127033 TaxID=3347110 RepID=UPI00365EFD56